MSLLLLNLWALTVLPVLTLSTIPSQTLNSQNPIPYALSPTYLQFLATQERKIYGALKDYTTALEKRLKLLKRYTEDYEEASFVGSSKTDFFTPNVVAANPILSFRMLNRYANEFKAIGKHLSENAEEVSSEIIYESKGIYDFPHNGDAEDASEAILRMQFTYNLRAYDISHGNIVGALENVGLTTEQCYKIAKTAQLNQYYTLALDWFNVTKVKLENELLRNEYMFDEKILESDITNSITEHNENFQQNYDDGNEYIFSKNVTTIEEATPLPLLNELMKKFSGVILNETDPDYYQALQMNHLLLCNGGNYQSEKIKQKLRCWYDQTRNPYWTISPLKIEMMNINPPIIRILDIINDKWISYYKTLSSSTLERAPTGPNATPRSAAYAWFKDYEIPETQLSKRIEFITGLNVVGERAAESLQIAAYTFGGHVELHFDSRGPDDPHPDPKGDRVATFLIYLNDVKEGGLTSFPMLGFSVKPIKGSAVLWYTNLRNGNVDMQTLHGACPLIYGHKWIATKWIHSNENIFKRSCGLDPLQ